MLGGGENQKEVIRPDFNLAIMIDFQRATIASDTGLSLREVDERFSDAAFANPETSCTTRPRVGVGLGGWRPRCGFRRYRRFRRYFSLPIWRGGEAQQIGIRR